MIRWLVYIDLFVLLRWEERSCWWSDVVPVFGYRAHAVANLQLLQLWSTLYGAISSSGSFRCRYRRWYESWLSLVAAAGKMIWWRRVTEWLAELRLSMPPAAIVYHGKSQLGGAITPSWSRILVALRCMRYMFSSSGNTYQRVTESEGQCRLVAWWVSGPAGRKLLAVQRPSASAEWITFGDYS